MPIQCVRLLFFCIASVWLSSPSVLWAANRIAIASVDGPRRAATAKLTEGVFVGFEAEGVSTVTRRRLREVARAEGVPEDDPRAAKAAGATHVVSLKVNRSRRKYFVTAELRNLRGGGLEKVERQYRRAKDARRTGIEIGRALAARLKGAPPTVRTPPPPSASRSPSSASPPPPSSAPPPLAPPSPPPTAAEAPAVPPPGPSVAGPAPARAAPVTGENNTFRFQLTAGSQLVTTYAVTVDGVDTGLTYNLNPIAVVQGDVQYTWVTVGLGARLEFSVSPVSYDVDVVPAVDPSEPSGSFFGVGGHVFYELELLTFGTAGRFGLAPLLGAGYSALTVDAQQSSSVVVSYGSVDVFGGVRGRLQLSSALAVDVDVRAGGVVSYTEDPTDTGSDGTGFSVQAGVGARYWFLTELGVTAEISYRLQNVSLSGPGSRAGFEGDPELVDATVSADNLRFVIGVVSGF